jgi:hypothetical protein
MPPSGKPDGPEFAYWDFVELTAFSKPLLSMVVDLFENLPRLAALGRKSRHQNPGSR